ncbi:MAG: hypothetical protein RJB42_1372 [Bacteroidota bacterium]|jgi:hypothetical protein
MTHSFILKFGKYKGQNFNSTPISYQNWLLQQDWFKVPSIEQKPPTISKSWDGYSRKGQAQQQSYFEYEVSMADKYDPIPDFYNFI